MGWSEEIIHFPRTGILLEIIDGRQGKPCDREEKNVSHGWASSQEGFDGRERPEEAQGCRVMGENEVSHDCNTPGTRIGRGCQLIDQETCHQFERY